LDKLVRATSALALGLNNIGSGNEKCCNMIARLMAGLSLN